MRKWNSRPPGTVRLATALAKLKFMTGLGEISERFKPYKLKVLDCARLIKLAYGSNF